MSLLITVIALSDILDYRRKRVLLRKHY